MSSKLGDKKMKSSIFAITMLVYADSEAIWKYIFRTPVLWIIVGICVPVIFSLAALRINKKFGSRKLWTFSGLLVTLCFLFSLIRPNLNLRYNNHLDASGIKTHYLSISLLLMTVCISILSHMNIPKTFVVVVTSIIGVIVLLIGSWIA